MRKIPIGPYKDFAECLADQKKNGKNDLAAHKICGYLEQRAKEANKKMTQEPYERMARTTGPPYPYQNNGEDTQGMPGGKPTQNRMPGANGEPMPIESMPRSTQIGPYHDFEECVQVQKTRGLSDEAAHMYCGFIEQRARSAQPLTPMPGETGQIPPFPPAGEPTLPGEPVRPQAGGETQFNIPGPIQNPSIDTTAHNLPMNDLLPNMKGFETNYPTGVAVGGTKAVREAEWTAKGVNDLPDSAFAYIEPGGKKDETGKTVPRGLRHLPIKNASGSYDAAHVRNALARLSQTGISDAAKAQAKRKICAGARALKIDSPTCSER